MAIRTDQVQLQIDFITDESRNFAKTLNATKQFNQEIDKSKAKIKQYEQELSRASTSEAKRVELLGKIAAEEKKVAAGLASIAAEGKKVEAIDLTKLTPAQLTQRAKQIEQSLRQMSQTAPAFKQLQGELAKVNGQLANIKSNSKGIQLERAASGGGGGGLSGLISLAGRAGPIIGTAIAAVGSLGAALKGASNAEQLQISFETFLGSAERAKRAIADLKGFEKNTPFDAEQVNSAGRALLAFGTAQEDLIPTLRQIGDIASGTGKDFNELTLIYGKAQAQGLIQGEELNQLAEAGIPIYAELAKQLGVNESQIRKLGSEGKISFKDLQGVFQNLTEEGGRFAGLTEKQSKSLGGLFSTLQSSLGEVLTKLGSVLAPVIKQFLEQLIPAIEKFGPVVVDVFKTVIGFFQGYGEAVNFIVNRTLQAVDRVVLNTQLAIDKTKAFFGDVEAGNRANETKKKLDKLYEDAGGGVVESFLRGFNKAFEDNKEALGDLGPGGGKAGGIITPKLTPEQIAERINKAIEVELKAIELGALKREVILGDFRAKDQISEARYQVGLVAIQEQSLEKQLEAYKRYGQDQTAEALKIQKDLQKLQSEQGERGFGIDNFGTLGQAGTGGVQRQGGNDGGQVGRDLASDALQEQLRSKFEAALITEGEYNVQRLELQRMFLQQEIDLMKGATVVQTDEIRKREEDKKKIEDEIAKQRLENLQRQEEFRFELLQQGLSVSKDVLDAGIELLGKDEAARKKNAGVIKAFETAKVQLNFIAEASAIAKNTQTAITSGVLGPVLANIIGGIQIAVAAARAAAATQKIAATKFARGGFTGYGYGSPDETGYRQAGVVHEGEYVVPKWQVNNPQTRQVISSLESQRMRGYADGGLVTLNTTPIPGPSASAGGAVPGADLSGFASAVDKFYAAIMMMPKEVRARVVLTELEDASSELNTVRNDASF